MAEAGKGDTPRPIVDRKQFEANWDTIFGKKCSKGLCENREHCGDLSKDEKHTIPLLGVI